MTYIYINDKMYATIIKHTEQTPALFIRGIVQEAIEKKGWDKK
jgi:hypothetical protein